MAFDDNQQEPTLPAGNNSYKRKSINHLPKYFRTSFNSKFLDATLDQLNQPGSVEKVNSFFGRKISKAYQNNDNYINDVTKEREDYQFEPSLIREDLLGNILFHANYNDYINKIKLLSGKTDDHSVLNSQEYYAWNPHIDWDKIINYREYYWLANGPETVTVIGQTRDITSTYTVELNDNVDNLTYIFSPDGLTNNPTLTLYRGQTYRFEVSTPSYPIAFVTRISFTPGVTLDAETENTSLLYNNGVTKYDFDGNLINQDFVDNGIIEFTVPDEAPESIFYISESDPNLSGLIKIFDIVENTEIDVDKEIIGKKNYKTSDGWNFSNGFKVKFAGNVTPEIYGDGEWYVEGVGSKIKLIKQDDLQVTGLFTDDIVVEFDNTGFDFYPFSESLGFATNKDYIVVNRASNDGNLWSRYNRWFHKSVIEESARLTQQNISLDQNLRASRPIIEFEAGLKLFNFGTKSKKNVDLVDDFTNDVFSTIEGSLGYNIDGIDLTEGQRILFTADNDILVKGRIFIVTFVTVNNRTQISLKEAEDSIPLLNENVLVTNGVNNRGKYFYFNGINWKIGQQKLTINQSPLFDLFDENGNQLNDPDVYQSSQFTGCKIFSYGVGEGSADSELGFPILYKNIQNTGDIVFQFDLLQDQFTYVVENALFSLETKKTFLRKYKNKDDFNLENGWIKGFKESHQPVLRQYIADGTNNYFKIDVYKDLNYINDIKIKLYKNNKLILKSQYTTDIDVTGNLNIIFNQLPSAGDVIVIKTISSSPKGQNGHYEFPSNLEKNPLNRNLSTFTLGEINDHVTSIVENLNQFTGIFPGTSNLRDLGTVSHYGNRFIKNSCPLALPMYHLMDNDVNIIKSIKFARQEYGKFKRNFVETASNLGYDGPAKSFVDLILKEINKDKTAIMPFYFSDMVPNGGANVIRIEIEDTDQQFVQLNRVFDLTSLSSKAVQVYQNGVQLIHNVDYVFNSEGFVIITGNKQLGDLIEVYEYETTNGSYVAATPTKLGLYPKFLPKFYIDDTFRVTPPENPQGPYKFYGCRADVSTVEQEIGWFFPLFVDINEVKNYDLSNGGAGNFNPIKFEGLNRTFFMPEIDTNLAVQDTLLYPEWNEGVPMIQGHDGSKFVAYKDYRDNLILELEKRIYNNIKIEYNPEIFDLTDFKPGLYRKTGITRNDLKDAQLSDFLEWTRLANVEYTNQSYFDTTDTFTFNYNKSLSLTQELLPGWWREIYQYAYDTDRPHTHPWEMLGFSQKPIWWEEQYGKAPYTSNNLPLWQDIEKGIIRQPNFKILPKYARPNLFKHLPVDVHGKLLSPNDSNIILNIPSTSIRDVFKFGDGAPVENAWKNSSEYPFSLISAFIVNRPAKVFAAGFDRINQVRNIVGQIVIENTKDHLSTDSIVFPTSINEQFQSYTSGLVNYVFDFLTSSSMSRYENYKQALQELDVKIVFNIAGFTNKEKFKLLLDSRTPLNQGNVFVPEENYKIFLNKSHVIEEIVYSGVIIEKQPEGFYILGYDNNYPVFNYKSVQQLNNDPTITVGGVSEGFVNWDADKTYIQNSIVKFENKFYRVNQTHSTADNFNSSYYTLLTKLPIIGGKTAKLRKRYNDNISKLPYGSLLTTVQDVVDFMLGYGKYLEDIGFTFASFDYNNYELIDWVSAVRKFLFFLGQDWQEGTFITISPGASQLNFKSQNGTVGNILETFYGYSIKMSNGNNLPFTNIKIGKDSDNNFSLKSVNTVNGIYAVRLPIVTYEHAVVLDNKTVFNDVIFDQEPGYRQERIKVLGYRTSDWNGTFSIPGFIYDNVEIEQWDQWQDYKIGAVVKFKEFYYVAKEKVIGSESFIADYWIKLNEAPESKLLPNWDYKVNQFADFYDLDSDNFDINQQQMAQHLIGYQKRKYLENIINDEVSQYKFYQGMILEKGTKNSLTKLFDSLASADRDSLEFYEEWAIKDGQYGGSYTFDEIEFKVNESQIRANPQSFLLTNRQVTDAVDLIYRIQPYEVYLKPRNYNHKPFPTKYLAKGLLKNAGYVNSVDVDYIVGTYDSILSDIDIKEIKNKDYVWVGNVNGDWAVYQYQVSQYKIEGLEQGFDPATMTLRFTTNIKNDIQKGDICGIYEITSTTYNLDDSSNPVAEFKTSNIYGFFKVVDVLLNTITFEVPESVLSNISIDFIKSTGIFTIFKNARVENLSAANKISEENNQIGDKIWIDNDTNDKWLVIQNQANYSQVITVGNQQDAVQYFYFFAYIDIEYTVNFAAEYTCTMTIYKDINDGTIEDRFAGSITGNNGSIPITEFTGNIYIRLSTTDRYVDFWATSSQEQRVLTDTIVKLKGGVSEREARLILFNKKYRTDSIGQFSQSISVDDRNVYMAVGAPDDGDGKVFVYYRAAETLNWQLQEILIPDPEIAIPGQKFGASVDFSSDATYLIIGSPDASYVKTKYQGDYDPTVSYDTGDIVAYQNSYWEANIPVLGQENNILFPSFINYNQILFDLNLDEEDTEKIPLLLAGNYPFTNVTADHFIIRVDIDVYQGIGVGYEVKLKWNTLTNANQTQRNLTNRQPFNGNISYFDNNIISQKHTVLYKVDLILYVDQTTNVPIVHDTVTTQSASANVVYVYTQSGSTTIYINEVNGEFLNVDSLFIGGLDFVGEYEISPNIETNTENILGGYLVLVSDSYTINSVNSDSGRGLVLTDVLNDSAPTSDRYYYNILDYDTVTVDSENTDHSLIRTLSYQGTPGFGGETEPILSRLYVVRAPRPLTDAVNVGDSVTMYLNNLKKTVNILSLDRPVTVVAGEILTQFNSNAYCTVFASATNSNTVQIQNVVGTFNNIDFLTASQSGNITARPTEEPLIGELISPDEIGLEYFITNRTDEVFDIWDGYINYKIITFLDGNPFEPLARYRYAPVLGYIYDFGQGQIVEDVTTGAQAEVMFYQRSASDVTIFVNVLQGTFSKGDLFGDNADIRMLPYDQAPELDAYGRENIYTVPRNLGQIQKVSLGYAPANIGKLLVFDSLTNLEVVDNDQLKNVEYWLYKVEEELLGIPRDTLPPNTLNLNWKEVFIIPTEYNGIASNYAKEGLVTIYRRFGNNLVLVRSFVSSNRSAQHRYGSSVKITYQNGLYRGFVTASESNVFYDGPVIDLDTSFNVVNGVQIYRTILINVDPNVLIDVRLKFILNGNVILDISGITEIDDYFNTVIQEDGNTDSLEQEIQLNGIKVKLEDKEKIYFAGEYRGSFQYSIVGNNRFTDSWYPIQEDSYGKIYFLKAGTENDNLYNWEYAKNKSFKGVYSNSNEYRTGDIVYVIEDTLGTLFVAITNVSPGPFNLEQWVSTDDLIDYVGYIPNDTTFKVLDDSAQDSSLPNLDNVFEFGLDFAVSNDGQVLIASVEYYNEPNVVAVYRNDNGFYAWSQNIISPLTNIAFGKSIAINDDGTLIAIGAPNNSSVDINTGKVYVYKQIAGKFEITQELDSPQKEKGELFGSKVLIDSNTLAVSAFTAEMYEYLYIDQNTTTFDNDLTRFKSYSQEGIDTNSNLYEYNVKDAGTVYVYESVNDVFVYGDSLNYDTPYSPVYNFSKSVYLQNKHVYIGLPLAKISSNYFGTVVDFMKPLDLWKNLRVPKNVVDINRIKRVMLYNSKRADKTLIQYLDYIDPLQGKIAGIAEENISFKLYYDPACYNNTLESSLIYDVANRWDSDHVGELWWDLTNAKFYYPSQEDVIFTANNFNKLFLSNTIDIYEWVKSSILPSEYDILSETDLGFTRGITGKSKYGDAAYTVVKEYDEISQAFTNYYYFWVKDTKILPNISGRTLTGYDVANLIADPKGQGYKFISLFSDDSFAIYNCKNLFKSDDVVLSIQYYNKDNVNNNIHNQYQIITEGLEFSLPNRDIEMKWVDSLVGYDQYGRQVPDPKLGEKEKYGILNNPRQGWFKNRIEALKQYVSRVNRILKDNLIVDKNLSSIQQQELPPENALNLYDITVSTRFELDFLGVAKARQAVLSLVINEGSVVDVLVLDPGRGYLINPSYTVAGKGSGLELNFEINAIGSIVSVDIVNGGKNYTDSTVVIVRKFSVLVESDETIGNKWAIYERDSVNQLWNRIRSQAYNVNLYWNFIDWYSNGYNADIDIDYVVDYSYELSKIKTEINDIVKINNIGYGGWLLLQKIDNQANVDYTVNYKTIGRQDGTIQFASTLYDIVGSSASFDSISFDTIFYDSLPTVETRIIFNAIKNDLFIDDLAIEYNNLFFAAIRYVLSEQQYVDWIFKTSFIKAKHNVGKLRQDITFNNDNLSSFEEYINEVKPFKSKLREYVSSYENETVVELGISDFDLLPFYNDSLGTIIPVSTKITDQGILSASSLSITTNKNWLDNLGFEVVDVLISNAGRGYQSPPVLEFVGGGGSGARATTTLGANGKVIAVNLVTTGSRYTATPDIVISGSLGNAGEDARFLAVLGNGKTRNILTKIKFDRISKNFNITYLEEIENFVGSGSKYIFNLKWPIDLKLTNIKVEVNNQELLRSEYQFRNIKDNSKTYTRYYGQIELTQPAENSSSVVISYKKDINILTAADRINLAYNSVEGNFGKDLAQLMDGIDYGGVELRSFDFGGPSGWDTAPWYTGYYDTYDLTFEDEEIRRKSVLLTFNYPLSLDVGTRIIQDISNVTATVLESSGSENILVEIPFFQNIETQHELRLDDSTLITEPANDSSIPLQVEIKSLIFSKPLENGITYNVYKNGVRIDDPNYIDNPSLITNPNATMQSIIGNSVVTSIQVSELGTDVLSSDIIVFRKTTSDGSFLPTNIQYDSLVVGGNLEYTNAKGISAEEIVVDGDNFYTPLNSKGPEEFLPGVVLDTLDITVYERPTEGASQITSLNYYANGTQTVFDIGITPINEASVFVKINNKIQSLNNDYIITGSTVEFNTPPAISSKINLITLGYSGVNILDIDSFESDGEINKFLTNIRYINQDISALVTIDGKVVNHTLIKSDNTYEKPNNIVIVLPEPPVQGKIIRYALFDGPTANYSSVTIDTFTNDGSTNSYILSQTPFNQTPAEWYTIVKINDTILNAGYNEVFDVTETREYRLKLYQVPLASLNSEQVRVFLNNIELAFIDQWTFSSADAYNPLIPLDQQSGSTILLSENVGEQGDKLRVFVNGYNDSTLSGGDYRFGYFNNEGDFVSTPGELFIDKNYSLGDVITVYQFSNHDSQGLDRVSYDIVERTDLSPGVLAGTQQYLLDGSTDELNLDTALEVGKKYLVFLNNVRIDDPNFGTSNPVTNISATTQTIDGDNRTILNIGDLGIQTNAGDILKLTELNALIIPDKSTSNWYELRRLKNGFVPLNYPAVDDQYTWVIVNGKILDPSVDYYVTSNKMTVKILKGLQENDTVEVIHFTNKLLKNKFGWRQTKDILNRTQYKVLDGTKNIKLAADLNWYDKIISVVNGESLPSPDTNTKNPGVVYIDKERIEYFIKDGNTLKQLRRGTFGTGIKNLYPAGLEIYDQSGDKNLPYKDETLTTIFTADGTSATYELDFVPTSINEFEVFVAGRRLRKNSIQSFQLNTELRDKYDSIENISQDSPEGDITIPAEFSITNINQLVLLETPLENQKVIVIRQIGKIWNEIDKTLSESNTDIAKFLQFYQVDLPR